MEGRRVNLHRWRAKKRYETPRGGGGGIVRANFTFGEHAGARIREQVDTFREEIARRTDTSRARSSYPQHPPAATEGDEKPSTREIPPSPLPAASIPPFAFPNELQPPPTIPHSLSSSLFSYHHDYPLLGQPLPPAHHAPCFMPNSRHHPRNLTYSS